VTPTLIKQKPRPGEQTRYDVMLGETLIGHVYSSKELSYRGMQGWNRGIRLKDFHPTIWRYQTPKQYTKGAFTRNRASGVNTLLEQHHASLH